MAMRHPPNFAPGTHWDYTNTGYILVGMIIKAVTGRTWDVQLRDRIIRPLGLRHTFSPGDSPFAPDPMLSPTSSSRPAGRSSNVTVLNRPGWLGRGRVWDRRQVLRAAAGAAASLNGRRSARRRGRRRWRPH